MKIFIKKHLNNGLRKHLSKTSRALSFLMVLTIIIACNGQKMTVAKQTSQNDKHMVLVDQNEYSGADSTETMVITNAKTLKSFYSRINRTRKPGLPVPEIDFSKNIVVVVCSANENFAGEEKLTIMSETDSEMVLGMKKQVKHLKDKSSVRPKKQVSPFFVYTMPLTDKKVSFEPME